MPVGATGSANALRRREGIHGHLDIHIVGAVCDRHRRHRSRHPGRDGRKTGWCPRVAQRERSARYDAATEVERALSRPAAPLTALGNVTGDARRATCANKCENRRRPISSEGSVIR